MTKLILLFSILSFSITAAPYLEYCAGSQLKYKDAGSGGTGGHAFVYIDGLCKDYSKGYPQVIPCDLVDQKYKDKYPHTGVGISLDSEYKNVNWVAIPTRELTFSLSSVNQIVEKSLKYKVFKGVELHRSAASLDKNIFSKKLSAYNIAYDENEDGNLLLPQSSFIKPTRSTQVFSTLYTIGTDIAINTARDLACIKLDLKGQSSLNNIADYLNDKNKYYYKYSENTYVWHMLLNNCTHLSLNLINVAGFESPYYDVNPNVKSASLEHFATALAINPNKAIKNMMTPADGFKMLKREQKGELKFYPAKKTLGSVFETKGLKVFSFDPLNEKKSCIHDFSKILTKSKLSQVSFFIRKVIFGSGLYTQYKNHFYKIEELLK